MTSDELLDELRAMANLANVDGMARFGISVEGTLGISIPVLRQTAKRVGRDHALAIDLWASGIHEARILASMIDDPAAVTPEQMDSWAADFDSWDVCDQVCGNLFDRTPHAFDKVAEWSTRDEEYVRRAAFALLAALAVHDKRAPDDSFLACFPLNAHAVQLARHIQQLNSRPARWIAADALRELTSAAVQERLQRKVTRA